MPSTNCAFCKKDLFNFHIRRNGLKFCDDNCAILYNIREKMFNGGKIKNVVGTENITK
jgi:hypothetical protein